MSKRFDNASAKSYTFHDGDTDREVIAIYMGGKRSGFIEIDAAQRLAERLLAICHNHNNPRGTDGKNIHK